MRGKIRCAVLSIASFLILSMTAFAAEKQTDVPLTKNYESCTFKIELERAGEYEATLVSPDGKGVFTFSEIEPTVMTCTVEKCKQGTWQVKVLSADEEDIGKIKVTVAATKSNETNAVDQIKVGKDINGLKIYFKDDSIVTEWTDESCGNVNVTVTNMDTNEIISNQTVKEQNFECPIPAKAENISVSVVPSSSSRISDAVQTYTYKVENNPDATVTYPEGDYANSDTIPVQVEMKDRYGIYVTDNDSEVLEKEIMDAGSYTFDVPLNDDTNDVKFYIVDSNGNMRSTQKSIIKDTEAPTLTLDSAYDGLSTEDSQYTISGTVLNYDTFTVNGEAFTEVATDGHFDIPVTLHLGNNSLKIVATDKAGNETTYDITLTQVEPEKPSIFTPSNIICVLLILLMIGMFIKKKIDKHRAEYEDDEEDDDSDDESDEAEAEADDEPDKEIEDDVADKIKHPKKKFSIGLKKKSNEAEATEKKSAQQKKKGIPEWMQTPILTIIFVFLVNLLITPIRIPTGSMEPTIMAGSIILTNDLAYKVKTPKCGDIVDFYSPAYKSDLLKRIIGVGGDEITFSDGYVYANGEKLDESSYLGADVETNCVKTFNVPDGYVFVMGDNREMSEDARYWEEPYVAVEALKGKYLFTLPF